MGCETGLRAYLSLHLGQAESRLAHRLFEALQTSDDAARGAAWVSS